jgi:hypothetical protein
MEKLVDKVFSLINKVPCMRELGKMINIMVKVLNNGITTKLFTRVTLLMDKRLEKESSSLMEMYMREISKTVNSTEKENTTSLSLEKSIKVNLMKTICMEKVK